MTSIRASKHRQTHLRKEWLVVMAIVFVALVAIVFTMCSTGHVGT